MQHLPHLRAIKGHVRAYGQPTDKRLKSRQTDSDIAPAPHAPHYIFNKSPGNKQQAPLAQRAFYSSYSI
jgi:hypothetical protein